MTFAFYNNPLPTRFSIIPREIKESTSGPAAPNFYPLSINTFSYWDFLVTMYFPMPE
jgi:hypothetical protein